jgi:hypothetical protein
MEVVSHKFSFLWLLIAIKRRLRSQCKTGWPIVLLTLPLFLMLANTARADADAPDTDPPSLMTESAPHDLGPGMMGPLVAIDVSPGNDVTPFAPHWVRGPEGRTLGFGFGVDKMLAQNWDIEVDSTFDSFSPHDGAREAGFGTVDILSRLLFINQPDVQAAVAPQVSLKTGSFGQGFGVSNAGLALLWGGRGGALPEDWNLGYFRALEFHSDLGYSRILSDGSGDEIFFDPVVDYSLPYLQYLNKSQLPWGVRNLCFFAELNLDAVVSGSEKAPTTLYTTPGISYLTDAYQVSAGVQLPLNHAGEQNQQIAVVAEIQFSLDDVPVLGWMPL